MADARQNEIKVSITVVATKTFTAGRRMLGMDEDILRNAGKRKSKNLAQCGSGIFNRALRKACRWLARRGWNRDQLDNRTLEFRGLWRHVGSCDAVVPAKLVLIHETPGVPQRERQSR